MIRRLLARIPRKWRDAASRAAWTGLQAGVAYVSLDALDLPEEWTPFAALGLSWLKSWIATKVGNSETVTFDVGHAGLAGTGPELRHEPITHERVAKGLRRYADQQNQGLPPGHSLTSSPPQPTSSPELRRQANRARKVGETPQAHRERLRRLDEAEAGSPHTRAD